MPQDLHEYIRNRFMAVLLETMPVAEFEQWVYGTPELERDLPAGDYLELISADYKSLHGMHELRRLLMRLTGACTYEKERLLWLLRRVLRADAAVSDALIQLYDLHYKRFEFLRSIAINYGLKIIYPPDADWKDMSPDERQKMVSSFYPALAEEAAAVIGLLETDSIRLDVGDEDSCRHRFK